jgi:hypothetical protein
MTPDLEDDLHATTEANEADARRLLEIEREKARLSADDPRLVALAEEAADIGARLSAAVKVEEALTRQMAEPDDEDDQPSEGSIAS